MENEGSQNDIIKRSNTGDICAKDVTYLPNECLLLVFSFCKREVLVLLRLVCQAWEAVAVSNCFWKNAFHTAFCTKASVDEDIAAYFAQKLEIKASHRQWWEYFSAHARSVPVDAQNHPEFEEGLVEVEPSREVPRLRHRTQYSVKMFKAPRFLHRLADTKQWHALYAVAGLLAFECADLELDTPIVFGDGVQMSFGAFCLQYFVDKTKLHDKLMVQVSGTVNRSCFLAWTELEDCYSKGPACPKKIKKHLKGRLHSAAYFSASETDGVSWIGEIYNAGVSHWDFGSVNTLYYRKEETMAVVLQWSSDFEVWSEDEDEDEDEE